MSAIGDYIHLTNKGYDYGILPKIARDFAETPTKQSDAVQAFINQKQKLDEMVTARGNTAEALKIQKGIYTFLNFLNSPSQDNKDFILKIIERIEEELKVEINTRCLDVKNPMQKTPERAVSDLQKILKDIQGTRSSDGSLQQRAYIVAKTARTLVESFKKFDQDLTNGILDVRKIKESYNTISNILNTGRILIQEIEKKYSDKKNQSYLFIQNFSGATPTSYYTKEAFYVTDPKTGAKISLITFAQELEKILSPFSFNANEKKGKVAELMLAAGSAWYQQRCKNRIDKVMKEAMSKNIWQGALKTNTTYITGKFIPGFEQQEITSYKQMTLDDETSILVNTGGGSDDKVDVMFYYSPNKPPAALSVKNYSLHTVQKEGFSGVKGAPFLSLLQLFNVDFVNHWINNTILHAQWDNHYKPYQRGKYLQQAHQLMRYGLVIYGALGGYVKTDMNSMTTTNQKQVDYLVWNNNSSIQANDIRVYPFSDILKNCYSKLSTLSQWIDETGDNDYGFFSTKNWSTVKFLKLVDNSISSPSEQAQLRILALLMKMHEIKISTHIFISE